MGGTINIEKNSDRGTTFVFTIKIKPDTDIFGSIHSTQLEVKDDDDENTISISEAVKSYTFRRNSLGRF